MAHVSYHILHLIDRITYAVIVIREAEHPELAESLGLDRHSLLLLVLLVLNLAIHTGLVVDRSIADQEGFVLWVLTTGPGGGSAIDGLVRMEPRLLLLVVLVVLLAEPHHAYTYIL